MKLYDINAEIARLLDEGTDPETGELLIDPAEIEALEMEREKKLEYLALEYKNLTAEASAIKAESDELIKRYKAVSNRAGRLKEFLSGVLAGDKFATPRVSCGWRKSSAVEVDDTAFFPWAGEHPEFLRVKPPEVDKKSVGDALKRGEYIPGAVIVERLSLIIR